MFGGGLTCVHLIHAVEEVVWRAGDAVAAHAQTAVRALVSGVVRPAARETRRTPVTMESLGTGLRDFIVLILVFWVELFRKQSCKYLF